MALRYIWKQPIHCISILSYSVNCIWTTREDIVRFRFCRLTRWIRDKTKDQVQLHQCAHTRHMTLRTCLGLFVLFLSYSHLLPFLRQVSQRMMKYSIVFVLLLLCMSLSSSLSLHKCYQQPACSPGFPDGSKQSGFTYNTGWSNSEASLNTCCQICPPGGKSTTCFDKTDEVSVYTWLHVGLC